MEKQNSGAHAVNEVKCNREINSINFCYVNKSFNAFGVCHRNVQLDKRNTFNEYARESSTPNAHKKFALKMKRVFVFCFSFFKCVYLFRNQSNKSSGFTVGDWRKFERNISGEIRDGDFLWR